jgi:hypothetical protein
MTRQVIHDHDAVIDCGILYQCPECRFQEWAVMACDGVDDDPCEVSDCTHWE